MTNEKMLSLINKAMENLRDNEDGYGQTPIDFMRKNGIKSTDNMAIFLDSVGAYLEEIRCGILADIETDAAKKAGKGSILATVRKLSKNAYNNNINSREWLAYAHHDEENNKYWLTNIYWLMIAENPEGLEMCPERIEQPNNAWKYQSALPKDYEMQELELPSIGKLTAYLKTAKSKASKSMKQTGMWSRIILSTGAAMNGEYLEMGMRLTGAKTIKYKDNMHTFVMEGNGYTFALCPAQNKGNQPPTDFDNI